MSSCRTPGAPACSSAGVVEHAEYVAALPRVDQRRVAVLAERAVFADLVEKVAVRED